MNKIEVIAHRGGFLPEGPIPTIDKYQIPENTLEAFARAFQNGWGIETDVRRVDDKKFVLSHDLGFDPSSDIPTLESLCESAKKYSKDGQNPFIAFQVKRGSDHQSGVKVGRAVAQKMEQYDLKDSILFDSTIEEAEILRREFPWLSLSVSVGEENYSPTIYTPEQVFSKRFKKAFNCIWADEWKIPGSIYNQDLFKKLRAAYTGRIDVISPELHYNENHPLATDLDKLKTLWQEIISWGIATGICTDYPSKLRLLT